MADTSYSSLLHGGEFKIGTAISSASDLSSSATDGVIGTGTVLAAIHTGAWSYNVVCFGVLISTAVTGGTDITVNLASCPTTASNTTNARAIGSCVIPSTAVIGDVVVNFPTDNLRVNPGERIIAYLRTNSTTAGAGHVFIHGYPTVSYPTGRTGTYTKEVATATGSIIVV